MLGFVFIIPYLSFHMYKQILRYFQCLGSVKHNGNVLKTGAEFWEKKVWQQPQQQFKISSTA